MKNRSPSRIVLTHWNAGVFRVQSLPYLLPELVIYSLIYDEVLIREEDLLTNRQVMRLLKRPENFRVFEEMLVAGLVKILRLPLNIYPEGRRFNPVTDPLSARVEEHELRWSYKGRRWRATNWEWEIVRRLDQILTRHKAAWRFHAPFPKDNPFAKELAKLLKNRKSYRHPILRYLDDTTAKTFIKFCRDPEEWLRFLFEHNIKSPILGPEGAFYRYAAYQCSEHLPTPRTVRRIVESVYAATYCNREGSSGHYGGSELVELPYCFDSDEAWLEAEELITNVEIVSTPAAASIALEAGIAEIVNRTRDSREFANIQAVIHQLATAPTEALLPTEAAFRDAWSAVAAAHADACAAVWAKRPLVVQSVTRYTVWAYKLARILGFRIVQEVPDLDIGKAVDEVVEYAIEHYCPAVLLSARAICKSPGTRETLTRSAAVRCSKVTLEGSD